MDSKEESSIAKAITAAKLNRAAERDGGPLVPSEEVLLIELCWALELLLEPTLDINFQFVPEVYDKLLTDLSSGELISYTARIGALIGSSCWPAADDEKAPYDMAFYHPVVSGNDCLGHEGETPIVPIEAARTWLKAAVERQEVSVTRKRNLQGEKAIAEFKAFINDPENAPITEEKRDRWSVENLSGGREKGRGFWRIYKPSGGSRPGPKT